MRQREENHYFAMTQQEIADAMGMSRPMVGSIESRAYEKFKKALAQKGYKIEDVLVDAR
jgi:DNA-directed RNA polymerase specialized sigma24 family protein